MMPLKQLFVSISLGLCTSIAQATPFATLTFDVNFQGYTVLNGVRADIAGSSVHDTVVLKLPLSVRDVQSYDNSYSSNYLIDLGNGEPSAGISITSAHVGSVFTSDLTDPYVNAAISQLGFSTREPSTILRPRDYAFVDKRDIHGAPASQRYLTWLDATIMGPSENLSGPFNAQLMSMVRVEGMQYIEDGNVAPFALDDVTSMLREIAVAGTPGFQVQYTRTIDSYDPNSQFFWTGRPFEITYGGSATLSAFTVDGTDILHDHAVPEPATPFIFAAGVLTLMLCYSRRAKS